ncbi:MAG: hypothetical protein U0746_18945 [Gemmataceae bacterium]
MVNSNPETVSTDYDTSDHLFFEPLTSEDVLNIFDRMHPQGAIVQFGGQTPLNLAKALEAAGVPIVGTSVDSIDRAETVSGSRSSSTNSAWAATMPAAPPSTCRKPCVRPGGSASRC